MAISLKQPIKCINELCQIYFVSKSKTQKNCSNKCSQASRKASGYKQICSEETKLKMSLSHKGKIKSEEHLENISKSLRGRKLSDETKKKIRDSQKGKKLTGSHLLNVIKNNNLKKGIKRPIFSKEVRYKMSISQKKRFLTEDIWNKGLKGYNSGDKHPNWKGGITSENRKQRIIFRRTLQTKIFNRDGYKCVKCQSNKNLSVDHIKSWASFPELRFTMSNCQTLCMHCHFYKTFGKNISRNTTWGHNLSKIINK